MKIRNHLLYSQDGKQINYYPTPNKGGKYTPQYLVMHYTAATTTESTLNWFQYKDAKASAHLLIGMDGAVFQFAPFNVVCWHAGKSRWNGLYGLNQYSIGIELVNGGRLSKKGDQWICPVDKKLIPNNDVLIATHKNEVHEAAWHEYSELQLEVSLEIATLLVNTYDLHDVVGHEDIAPIRKSDPGPAFPLKNFRAKALGRKDVYLDEYATTIELNIRQGPGTGYMTITKPLPTGTKVLELKREGNWSLVEVQNVVHGLMDLEGWVFRKYLA